MWSEVNENKTNVAMAIGLENIPAFIPLNLEF